MAARKHATRRHPTQSRAAAAAPTHPRRAPQRQTSSMSAAQGRSIRPHAAPANATRPARSKPLSGPTLAVKDEPLPLGSRDQSVARISWAMLVAFFQGGWLISTALVGLALGFLLFWRPGGATYIFTTASFAYGALAFATAAMLVRSLRPGASGHALPADVGRVAYLRGLTLTMAALEVATVALLLAALLLFGRIQDANTGMLLAGMAGLLANCVALGVIAGALFGVMSQRICIVALAWLVAGLWSYSAHPPLLRDVLYVARLPLIPFGTLYNAGATGDFGWRGALALLCEATLVGALLWVAPLLGRWTRAGESTAGLAG